MPLFKVRLLKFGKHLKGRSLSDLEGSYIIGNSNQTYEFVKVCMIMNDNRWFGGLIGISRK